jgi:N-acetyl-anhydromuramyl-L-alanine amidase AmpD
VIPFLVLADPPPVVERPAIVRKYIPYGATRKRQMAAYSERHYGVRTWRLEDPRQIVLHYTVSDTWQSPWNHFANNTPAGGPSGTRPEPPGGCTHFLVGKRGTIIQLAPLRIMCRHTIGLNHRSIGIEFVEMRSASNILQRPRQLRAGLRLVRWLQYRADIATRDVIGHGTANDSPYFQERVRGWRNDHTDWNAAQMRTFRAQL